MNYAWFATVAQAFDWVLKPADRRLLGVLDSWTYGQGTVLATNRDIYIWMNHVIAATLPSFLSNPAAFDATPLMAMERTALSLTEAAQQSEWTRVQAAGDYGTWTSRWTTWRTFRLNNDGATAAAQPPSAADLPNGATILDVQGTADPATFPAPYKWTPLKVGTKTQKYLTMNWNDTISPSLTAAQETQIKAAAEPFATNPGSQQRSDEIAEVVQITATLTDALKVQAEFWAGGPNTVAPPGMCIWFWKELVRTSLADAANDAAIAWNKIIYSGLELALALFETARLVWGLKKAHAEARPIQEIRRLYRGQTLTGYDGAPVQGESWVPYQETNFVTPPFPDFPSGHSAFSQTFANVMTAWFGPTIPTSSLAPSARSDIALLSPALAATATTPAPLATFTFPAGASLIQPTIVPAQPQTFSWTTWQAMADAAGLSRKYGGIHAASAHVGSQALANALTVVLQSLFIRT
jgi:membrane-associated phospholipid phosphatase